jgi:hypothetical protein
MIIIDNVMYFFKETISDGILLSNYIRCILEEPLKYPARIGLSLGFRVNTQKLTFEEVEFSH